MNTSDWNRSYLRASFHRALQTPSAGEVAMAKRQSSKANFLSASLPKDTVHFGFNPNLIRFYTHPIFPLQPRRPRAGDQSGDQSIIGWKPQWNSLSDSQTYPFYGEGMVYVVSADPAMRKQAAKQLDEKVLQTPTGFRVLNAIPGQFTLEAILHLLTDPDPSVRLETAKALPKLKGYHIPDAHPDGDQKDASSYRQYMGVVGHALVTHPDADVRRIFPEWIKDPEKQQALAHYVEVCLGLENHGYESLPFQSVGVLKALGKHKLASDQLKAFAPVLQNPAAFKDLTEGIMKVGPEGLEKFLTVARQWSGRDSLRPLLSYALQNLPPAAHEAKAKLSRFLSA